MEDHGNNQTTHEKLSSVMSQDVDPLMHKESPRTIMVDDIYSPMGYVAAGTKSTLKTYYVYSRQCTGPTVIKAESKDAIRKGWEDKENPIVFINED
jgi:hypothetical protein